MTVNRAENNDAICGFCGRRRNEVQRMIAGLTAQICDECIALSIDALAGDPDDATAVEEGSANSGREAVAAALSDFAVDQVLAGVRGAPLETEVRVLAAVALLHAGHFDLTSAATFAGLAREDFERALEALGPPPAASIRPSRPPPPA